MIGARTHDPLRILHTREVDDPVQPAFNSA